MATAGADGTFSFWEVKAHRRLKAFSAVGGAVTACAFDRTGDWFAYAVGYDWSKGFAHSKPECPTRLMLHPAAAAEVTFETARK